MFPPPHFRRSPFLPYRQSPFTNFPPNFPVPPAAPFQTPTPGAAPNKLTQFLQTTEQFMKTAQNYQPYIQQARPLLKNLPAMWNLYKGFTGTSENKQSINSKRPLKSND